MWSGTTGGLPAALRVCGNAALSIALLILIGQVKFTNCPPSFRFPPLREGNQAHRFPLRGGGTLRRGLSTSLFS